MKDYIISYQALNRSGNVIKRGKIKVKRKYNELHAKVSLDMYLRKHYGIDKLVVFSCYEDSILSEIFSKFN